MHVLVASAGCVVGESSCYGAQVERDSQVGINVVALERFCEKVIGSKHGIPAEYGVDSVDEKNAHS